MAKPKSPLLSFGARGTIGDTLTYQKRGQATIAREKPIPKDPYSLAQAYQRWDYRDYAHLWTLQSNATKQTYRTRASRYHITGFSLWMREHLKDLPDILGRWHLDEQSGIIAHDSSKNANDGTVTGALPADGLIDHCRLFDGIDDLINCGNDPSLYSPTFSIEFFIKPLSTGEGGWGQLFWKQGAADGFNSYMQNSPNIVFSGWYGGIAKAVATVGDKVSIGVWHHIHLTWDGSNIIAYVDNEKFVGDANANPLDDHSVQTLYIGARAAGAYDFDGYIDEFVMRSRLLDEATIKRHSERRYSL